MDHNISKTQDRETLLEINGVKMNKKDVKKYKYKFQNIFGNDKPGDSNTGIIFKKNFASLI